MTNIKYTEEVVIEKCKEKQYEFVALDRRLVNGQNRRVVDYICTKHEHIGIQTSVVEKLVKYKNVCRLCNRKNIKETFSEEINRINDTVEITSEYIRYESKISCRCKICGNEWDTTPSSLYQGCGCPKCGRHKLNEKRMLAAKDVFIEKVKAQDENIIILGEYERSNKNILCKCAIDGSTWESTPSRLIIGQSHCPTCTSKRNSERQSMGKEEFIKRLNEINDQIVLIGDYKCVSEKTEFYCKKHDEKFICAPGKLLYRHKRGCQKCSSSLGENEMCKILDKLGIDYVRQETLDGCKNISDLKYDAYSEKLKTAFEFQGGQHYFPVDFAGKGKEWAEENFRINQHRDSIKREYCKEHNVRLIEIPYWEFERGNMENFIIEQLKIA